MIYEYLQVFYLCVIYYPSDVKCLPATCVRAPYCTETESSQHKVKENRIREFLSSHSGGRVELDKDNSTGLATITINNPEIRNGFSGKYLLRNSLDAVITVIKFIHIHDRC